MRLEDQEADDPRGDEHQAGQRLELFGIAPRPTTIFGRARSRAVDKNWEAALDVVHSLLDHDVVRPAVSYRTELGREGWEQFG